MTTITAEDISYLAAHPNNADGEDVAQLCSKIAELQAEVERLKYEKSADAEAISAALNDVGCSSLHASYVIRAFKEDNDRLKSWERSIKTLVSQQALDDGLWFFAESASESYLQEGLRKLHALIECGQSQPQPLGSSHNG